MVQISDRAMKILKCVNICLLALTIVTLLVSYFGQVKYLSDKEELEKIRGKPNKDAYQFARFIAGIGTGLGVGARVMGIYATLRESLNHSLVYGSTLVVILLCCAIGVIKMSVFDLVFHFILIALAFIFARLIGKEEPFSKEIGTLPL